MRKITLKTTKYEYNPNKKVGGKTQIEACVGDCLFADTKELAGTRRGFSGDWTVTNMNGETKHFTTEKGIREWLGNQKVAEKEEELSMDAIKTELKRMKENNIKVIMEGGK
jgi:hypothetical protein